MKKCMTKNIVHDKTFNVHRILKCCPIIYLTLSTVLKQNFSQFKLPIIKKNKSIMIVVPYWYQTLWPSRNRFKQFSEWCRCLNQFCPALSEEQLIQLTKYFKAWCGVVSHEIIIFLTKSHKGWGWKYRVRVNVIVPHYLKNG